MARFIASLTLIVSLLPLAAAERRVPTVDDLLTLKSIGGAQISPDGTRIVFTQTEWRRHEIRPWIAPDVVTEEGEVVLHHRALGAQTTGGGTDELVFRH